MADPVTMAAVSMGASAAGAGVSAFGSLMKGDAEASTYNYKAGIARMNQQISLQNAEWTRNAGEVEAQQSGMKSRAQIGETKAIQGGSGLDVNTGSAVKVRQSEQEIAANDEALIRSNAAHKAYGFEVEAAGEAAEAQLDEFAAKNSKKAGMIGAISSILGGVSSVADKWLKGSQLGMFKGGSETQEWSYAEGDD